jgi:HAD superfamily hydrolase (TIGR01509 family)
MRPIVFDCDGVLVDSEELSWGAWAVTLAKYDVTLTADDRSYGTGRTFQDNYRNLAQRGDLPPQQDFGAELGAAVSEVLNRHLNAFQDAVDTLEALQGKADMAVASSSSRDRLDLSLETTNLLRFFSVSVAGDEVERGKPAPDMFLAAADLLEVSPETCVAVEDTPAGIASAKAAGMTVVAVQRGLFDVSELGEADAIVPRLTPICLML